MGDSAMTVFALIIAIIIMAVIPLISMASQVDETAGLEAQTATTEFVNEIRATGVLTLDKYNNFVATLAATGNSYDVSIEAQISDGNLEKKSGTSSEKIYYTKYTTQIIEELNDMGKIIFKEGDTISVSAYRTNVTILEQLTNYFNRNSGNSTGQKVAEATGLVTTTGN